MIDDCISAAGRRPLVSVVIPHYSDLEGLGLCLDALARQTFDRDGFEVIVSDNGSPEGEAAVAAVIDGRARLVVVDERGAGPARNGGVAVATGEILAFTDSDCRPEPGWLAAGVEALLQSDFVGGRMVVIVDDVARPTAAEAFECVFAFANDTYVRRKGFSVSANLFCAKATFETVGGFRVGLSEDVDWCQRASAAGFEIGYAPGAVVSHPARKTWHDLKNKWRRMNAETYALWARRPAGRWLWLIRSLGLPLSALAHAPRVLTSRSLAGPSQRFAAMGMLFRLRLWRMGDALSLFLDGWPDA